ncbi:acyl-homoserine lactone synthase [Novosphingobium sp. PhB55]|uniref:acyl-homoserine-lactone synthase n=1 Tax=Novosphingobium sp. PhB55 TaxID=2485106 RepID=UPI001065DEAA|nr:acyl-homoserine-lactone synthase [Novosphingobium sp. PhB55]TDW61562.1 acyl-homoserine lactone synthase [Novosphingobium sp. PhB55]
MIYLVRNLPERAEDVILRNMFIARKKVFVDLLGWDVPVLAGCYELDQFDTPDATYIVLAEADGGHRASARLLPSERPHILSTLFPELCRDEIPSGVSIREITRFCLDPSLGARGRRAARGELVAMLAGHALKYGITHYTGVAEEGWLRQILGFGWRCRQLGEVRQIGRSRLGAVLIDIDEDTPMLLERAGIGACAELDGVSVHVH